MTPPLFVPALGRSLYPGASVALDFTRNLYRSGTPVVKGSPSLLSGWTFTRASTGYAETAAGALVNFASGEIRRTDKGLLVEESRTNLLLRSQEFDNASWTKVAATVTANATDALDGTVTADALTEDTATSAHLMLQIPGTVTAATTYTVSVFARANGRSWVQLIDNGASGCSAYFNLAAGTVGTVTGTGASGRIQALSGGWYRCSLTLVTTGVQVTINNQIRLATGDTVNSYTGDGASGIYLWGAQLEAGAFPTSYIPTTTASATRAADVPTLTVPSTATGTLVSDALGAPGAGLTKVATHVSLSNADDSTAWVIFGQTNMAGATTIYRRAAGLSVNTSGGSAFSAGARTKIAMRFGSAGGDAVSINGAAATAIAAAASPLVTTQLRPGRWASDPGELNSYVRAIILYPAEFTNAQLVAATA